MDKITEIQLNNTPKAELQNLVSCADDDFKLLLDNNPLFETLVNVLVSADLSANIKRSLVVKIVDDVWISTIENALPALDKVLRRPSRFIVEQDKVLPIEQSKNITARSIRDLAQHSDYIKDVSDGNVVPSKILNVFREETIRTYENRFVNTLVHRLFDFINKRYRRAQQLSMDEKKTELDLSSEFSSGKLRGIINLNIQLLEPPIASELNQKDIFDENKWERVEKIYGIARDYIGSEFIKSMGNDFVRPPIMRTNAILKNPDLRQCLALWEFVESYDDMGYYSISTESTTPASDKLISDMAKAMSLQLAYLRWATVDDALNVKGNIMQDKPKEKQSKSVTPSFDKRGVASGAVADDAVDEQEQKRILDAIAVCIDISREQMEKKLKDLLQQKKFDFADKAKYRWSFYARLVTLGEIVQQKYGAIKNYLLSFNNVRSRFSIDGETFYYKRNKLAKMTVKGKTLVLHLALSPLDERLSKYHVYDSSDVAKYQDVPCTTKIKSDRAVKYAKLMIDLLMQDKDVQLGEVQNVDYMLPSLTFEQLLDECLVKLIGSDSPLYAQPHNQQAEQTQEGDEDLPDEDEDDVDDDDEDDNDEQEQLLLPDDDSPFARRMYRWSFYARLVTLGAPVQQKYAEIKNHLLSYKKVRSSQAFDGETFYYKRVKLAKMIIKGKTLSVYFAKLPDGTDLGAIHYVDRSDVTKYKDIPCCLKVKSDRAVKHAKTFADLVMQNNGVVLGEVQNIDYSLAYQTVQQLLEQGWIKVVNRNLPADGKFAFGAQQQVEQTDEQPLPTEQIVQDEQTQDQVDEDDDEDDNDEQEQLLLPDDDSPFARRMYRWSFYARLVTLGAPVQQKYAEIKNHLLSYKKVRSSQAFDGETFYYKRVKLAKMIIKGKTLSVYFAKLPDGTDLGAIHYVDRSDVTKYKDIPCCLKVKSDRAVKHAKTFADLVMQNNGVVLGEVQNVDYSLAYQTVQQLIEQGWIKEVTRNLPTDGNTDNQRQDDRSEQLQNVASSLPLSRNMGLVYEPEWDKTTNGNNGASKAVSITPIYYGDMQNDIVTHHVAPQQPQQQSIDKYDAAHSFQEKALAVVEKTGHEQSKKKKEIVNAEVDYKWHINVADEGELFSKFPKEEIEKVLNKVRQHTVNYSINQVEGEIIVCYKTLAKMKWFKRRHYRKILNGNDVKAITSVLDKLMKKYLSDLK